MVAFMLKSEGNFLWACKSYDGEVQGRFLQEGYKNLTVKLLQSEAGV